MTDTPTPLVPLADRLSVIASHMAVTMRKLTSLSEGSMEINVELENAAALLRELAEGHQIRINDMQMLKRIVSNGAHKDDLTHYFESIEDDSKRLLAKARGES